MASDLRSGDPTERPSSGAGRVHSCCAPDASRAPVSGPSYSARETHGQSVATFFRGMLAARPPSDADEPSGRPSERERNEPARPALDGLSLRPVPGPEGADKTDAAVSFDDFFGSQEKGAGAEKGGDPGNDDLDQFHSWLQNLKP